MKKTLFLYLLFLIIPSFFNAIGPGDYLVNCLGQADKRFPTMFNALYLLEQHHAKVLVETGTARDGDKNFGGDGGSTIIFGKWASQNGAMLYSVDITPSAIENAKKATEVCRDQIQFTCGDSIQFLKEFDQSIDFLYLDSFDFDFGNPLPSQEHHLKEIMAAYPKLHQNSIVMIDDCDLPYGGKGKLAIEYLTSLGWVIFQNGYQVIMMQESSF